MTRPVSFFCRVPIVLELYRRKWQGGNIHTLLVLNKTGLKRTENQQKNYGKSIVLGGWVGGEWMKVKVILSTDFAVKKVNFSLSRMVWNNQFLEFLSIYKFSMVTVTPKVRYVALWWSLKFIAIRFLLRILEFLEPKSCQVVHSESNVLICVKFLIFIGQFPNRFSKKYYM